MEFLIRGLKFLVGVFWGLGEILLFIGALSSFSVGNGELLFFGAFLLLLSGVIDIYIFQYFPEEIPEKEKKLGSNFSLPLLLVLLAFISSDPFFFFLAVIFSFSAALKGSIAIIKSACLELTNLA